MRRGVLLLAAAILLVGPTVLAFVAGGYFEEPRLVATCAVWILVLVIAFASPRPLPASRAGWAVLGGLSFIALWTAVSFAWAPLPTPATGSLVRLLLYLGALLAALGVLRDQRAVRALEPALAAGAAVVIGYGLAGRLLPGMIDMDQSWRADGRLEQPITYWNAEGALAAMGMVLCVRVAGDSSRPVWMRSLASATSIPLALGAYLSYSRGAIAAALIGLVVVIAAAPSRAQLRAAITTLGVGVLAAACSVALPGVASLEGTAAERASDGAIMLAILVPLMVVAGLLESWMGSRELSGRLRDSALPASRRLPAVAIAAIALSFAGLVASGLAESSGAERPSEVRGPARLTSVDSRRYDYWRVGVDAFAEDPLKGVGAGGFRTVWLRERPVAGYALEVHSLPLEMAVELGLVGLFGFGIFIGGLAAAARRALLSERLSAAGPAAAGVVWLLHSTIDWDWQIPAVTLPAIILCAALIAIAERRPRLTEDLDELTAHGWHVNGAEPKSRAATASPAG
jgi:O-Antigen ligase